MPALSNRRGEDILIYMKALEVSIKKAIEEHGLIKGDERVLVGLSGGADSVALLSGLFALSGDMGFSVAAAHLNHGIRGGEAEEDMRFSAELCAGLGIPIVCETLDIPAIAKRDGKTLEQAARDERYAFFNRTAERLSADRIAVAHHMDDQAESILLHLIRGSGLKGLIGMEPMSGRIIRPLLFSRRGDIEAYLASSGLSYRTDSTNLEREASRNRLRLDLIPYIQRELNPAFVESLCSTGELLRQDEEYLDGLARGALGDAKTDAGYDRKRLSVLPPPLLSRAIRIAVFEAGARADVERVHIERIMEMLTAKTGTHADIPHISVWVSYGDICFGRAKEPAKIDTPFNSAGKTCFEGGFFFAEAVEGDIIKDNAVAYMDMDKLPSGLTVRTRREGDRIHFIGSPGSKKLKDFFIDRKVPREKRDVPILFCGSEALFIPGLGISERVRADGSTRRLLRVTYTKNK